MSAFFRKLVPVSSLLYNIASNYKDWNITFAKKQDSFFSNYFEKALIHTMKYNASERNIYVIVSRIYGSYTRIISW